MLLQRTGQIVRSSFDLLFAGCLQHSLEVFLGHGVVGIQPQGGAQVSCRGLKMSLIHVEQTQITMSQIIVRIMTLDGLELRLRLRVALLMKPKDPQM